MPRGAMWRLVLTFESSVLSTCWSAVLISKIGRYTPRNSRRHYCVQLWHVIQLMQFSYKTVKCSQPSISIQLYVRDHESQRIKIDGPR